MLPNRAIVPVTVYETVHTRGPNFPKLFRRYINCSGTPDCSTSDTPSEVRMMYEVLIPTTVAMVLLPFNFWGAAEIVLWVRWSLCFGSFAMLFLMSFASASLKRADH
jgi:RsiW-degrading membrane proteinase PrsW (M82 family)